MSPDADEWGKRVLRAGTGALFYVSLAVSDLVPDNALNTMYLYAFLGLVTPAALAYVWKQRTRPQNTAGWWLVGLLVTVGLVATGFVAVAAALVVGFALAHDMQMTPSVMIAGGVLAQVLQFDFDWAFEATNDTAWWVATGGFLAVAAATVERDRLAWGDGRPVALAWTGVRVGFVGLWTIVIIAYREQLQAGRVFAWFGASPTGFEGQVLLLAILLTSLVVAGFLFRTRKKPTD